MTATIAGNNYLINMPMPYIGQFDHCGNGYDYQTQPQFVKTEFYQTQKQQQQQPSSQQSSSSQEQQYGYLPPMSGSTSPRLPVPNLLYSNLEQYENDDDSKNVQIKTEYDYHRLEDSVSSADSSPYIVSANEFEQPSQFAYNYPNICDDSSSEPTSSPTVANFTLSPESLSQYYSIIQSTPLDQNSAVQPSFTDQMRFIIYEPRSNDINNFQVPMTAWSLPVSTAQTPITTVASSQAIQYDYPNQVLVNPAQINPIQPVSSSSSSQQPVVQQNSGTQQNQQSQQSQQNQQNQAQQQQQQQQQQQLIKCPHEDCPKTFSRLYNLKAHLRSHSPARPYQCPMCPRSFSRKHDLQRHIRVHTGVKPYQCPCCRKAFARTDALRRHFKMEETCRNSPEVQNMKTRRRYSEMH